MADYETATWTRVEIWEARFDLVWAAAAVVNRDEGRPIVRGASFDRGMKSCAASCEWNCLGPAIVIAGIFAETTFSVKAQPQATDSV